MTTTPAFPPQQPGEGWSAFGRRGLLYVLQTDTTFTLSDDGLAATADYVNTAVGAPMSDAVRARLVDTQARMRALLAGRQANARALAALDAAPAAAPAVGAPDAPQGDGGAKVPRVPAPTPLSPSTGLQAPRVAVPAGMPAPVRPLTMTVTQTPGTARVTVRPAAPAPKPAPVAAPVFSPDLF